MATPKIRHLAIFARDPAKMARYYQTVFDMKLVHTYGEACFVSDGYLTMAILKHRLDGSALRRPQPLRLRQICKDSNGEIVRRTAEFGLEAPRSAPPTALRGIPRLRSRGNFFDVLASTATRWSRPSRTVPNARNRRNTSRSLPSSSSQRSGNVPYPGPMPACFNHAVVGLFSREWRR